MISDDGLRGTSRPEWTVTLPEIVVVTGSASGLGRETAGQLVSCGVAVIGVDQDRPDAMGHGYEHVEGSVLQDSTWGSVLERVGQPASLGYVGSAAVLKVGSLLDEDPQRWRDHWEVNVMGNVLALRALLPRMMRAEQSSVVAVSSVDATFGEQQLAAYAASKGALSAGLRSVALDYARSGIRINVLAPGPMKAGLFERHLASAADPSTFLATRSARQPRGCITGVDEVAQAALFLLSPASSALLGSTVTADAGLTAGFDFRTGAEGSSVETAELATHQVESAGPEESAPRAQARRVNDEQP